jgi:capsular polysaccharide biosynthesis protein
MSEVTDQNKADGQSNDGGRVLAEGPIIPERFDEPYCVPHTGLYNEGRFVPDKLIKSVVFTESHQSTPPIYALNGSTDIEYSSVNQYREYHGKVEDIGFYFAMDVKVRGRNILVKGNRYLYAKDLMPDYVEQEIKQGVRLEAYASDVRFARPISGTTVLLGSEGYPIYGHWLVDILPRAWLFKECFGAKPDGIRYLFGSDVPAFGRSMLSEIFGVNPDEIDVYDISTEEPLLERAIIPSMPHNSHVFHPALKRAVAYIVEWAHKSALLPLQYGKKRRKIYISRSKFRKISISSPREISNEQQLERTACDLGFEVIYPEELTFLEQVKLFYEASVVVGESGSGLHNTVFSQPGTVVLCLRPATQVQGTLAAVLDQILFFLCPSDSTTEAGTVKFEIDPARFERALLQCVARFEDPWGGNGSQALPIN